MLSAKLTANQVATMYFAHSSELLSNIANILGQKEDNIYYEDLSKKIKYAFKKAYVDTKGIIYKDMQGLYALAAPFEQCNLSYKSLYGNIEVKWELSEDKQEVNITVPVGVIITLKLPDQVDKEFGSGSYKISI